MIVLNLACASGHLFEGWFASAEAFDRQLQQALISCPHCNSTTISRLPSGPRIAKPRGASTISEFEDANVVEAVLEQLRRLGDASEDVGDQFPDEARRIHRHESNPRSIKGQASLEEMQDLIDEGVPVLPIPAKKTSH
ncbi:MAG: DUF1178 family protein [Rhodocyclales bacterium]|nr:DUF1178 family protein [Rhodocyclales bacterium]